MLACEEEKLRQELEELKKGLEFEENQRGKHQFVSGSLSFLFSVLYLIPAGRFNFILEVSLR